MTEEEERIARAFVEWSGWKWKPGMQNRDGDICAGDGPVFFILDDEVQGTYWRDEWKADAVPDVTDDATRGAILALVRGAWGDPLLHVACSIVNSEWSWSWYAVHSSHPGPGLPCNGNTEIEVLLSAALATPVKP